MSMEVKGKVVNICEGIVRGTFRTQQIWIETLDGKYPQTIAVECHADKISLIEGVNVGDVITASFNLRGKPWKDKCFNTLSVWKIQNESGGSSRCDQRNDKPSSQDDSEDIPF